MVDIEDDLESRLPAFVPPLVVLAALGGFVWLAWYAYHSGAHSLNEDTLLIIEADSVPIKEKPLDPGGMKFPNKDKTIYDTFASRGTKSNVENILPGAEEPMVAEIKKAPAPKPQAAPKKEVLVQSQTKAFSPPKIQQKKVNKPKVITVKKKPKPKAAPKKVVAKELPAPKAKASTSKATGKSDALIQLGAWFTQKEALDAYDRLKKRYKALNSKTPIIQHLVIKGRNYYRLRIGDFASKQAAKDYCAGLKKKKIECRVL